jgi:tripartite ATP-independent transporter DctM subunit
MDPIVLTTTVVIIVLFAALGSGIWIGLALCVPAYVGIEFFTHAPVGRIMANSIWGWTSLWSLAAMPLFVWMGEILYRSRLSEDMFSGLAPWLARLPGGLLHVNIVGCALFAAASGSSAVTAATIGKMSLPELRTLGYPEDKSLGTLAGSGTLGFLIPPSILLIVYGATAELSISRLFIAGVLPGLLVVVLFMGFVIIWSIFNRDKLPKPPTGFSLKERIYRSRHLIPVVFLITAVIGSIYAGVATPTEAAAVGVAGGLAVSYFTGSLSRKTFIESVLGATRTTCMIGLIVAGAGFLTIMMAYTKIPRHLALWIDSLDLSINALIFALTLFYILLGLFLEGISIIVLSAAIILPMVERAGIDLIWFGIYLVFVVELALITPPVGFNLFIIQGLTGRSIFYVARVAFPFFCLLLVALTIIVMFPEIATWLPKQMVGR